MSAIGGLFGLSGGTNGTGFAAPQTQNVIGDPINQQQIDTGYQGSQSALTQQQQLLQALQAQNGISNQSQVYSQLQGVAAGTGPNPAQAMLNQSTGQNIAAQAALMAGQRGTSANPGLIARQIAQQGAATQQQAVGQGSSLQAQQSLNAIGQAGQMANTQAANQVGQTNANTAAQQAQYNALLGAQANLNNANAGLVSNANSVTGQLTNTQMQGQQKQIGGVLSSLPVIGGFMGADGGVVPDLGPTQGPQSMFGQFLSGQQSVAPANISAVPTFSAAAPDSDKKGASSQLMELAPLLAAAGGKVPALLSPGEKYLAPQEANAVARGANPAQVGKVIPGKPKVKGNSYANDVVPAKLEEGGVVIPNSVMQSKDPVRGAADFVRKSLAKKGMKA